MPFVAVFFLGALIQVYGVNGRSLNSEEKQCKLFFFYDHGTDMCEHCREICDHADIRGTEAQCASSCSDYLAAKKCTSDEYFDEHVHQCGHCAELCTHPESLGTKQQCNETCKDYMSKEDPSISLNTASRPGERTQDDSPLPHLATRITLTVLLSVLATVILVLLAVGIYCTKTRCTAYRQAPQRDDASVHEMAALKYGQQEQGQPGERAELVPNTT